MTRVYGTLADRLGDGEPGGYLYRTALNLQRKRVRVLAVPARRVLFERQPDEIGVADDRLDVLRAISSLLRSQREALVLVEWLGFGAEDASVVLGIDPTSVRTRLHRARTTLRDRLGGRDG